MPQIGSQSQSRRAVIQTLSAAAAVSVAGCNTANRGLADQTLTDGVDPFSDAPPLDGERIVDPESLLTYAEDFGHLVHRTPRAVFKPSSADDLVQIVRFAGKHGIALSMRGQGHAQYGQGLVEAGILVDSSALNSISDISGTTITVGAGALWGDVTDAALAAGLAPPVTLDTTILSVGGVLAGSGGYGTGTSRYGLHSDHVAALDVVTGTGERIQCSQDHKADVFHATLLGQGQCALIVNATLNLIPAPAAHHVQTLSYDDLASCLSDATTLARLDRWDSLGVSITPAAGGFAFALNVGAFAANAGGPGAELPAGLKFKASSEKSVPIATVVHGFEPAMRLFKASPAWRLPHPWLGLLLPASKVAGFTSDLLASPDDIAGVFPFSPVSLMPISTSKLTNKLMRAPDEDIAFSVLLLRNAPSGTAEAMLAANRKLYERARALGGNRMLWGAIPFTAVDWKDHYGSDLWAWLRDMKRRTDPHQILSPGPGIFHDQA